MKRIVFTLGAFWALPVTVAGFLLAFLSGCKPYAVRGGAVTFISSALLQKFLDHFDVAAFTWGGVIVFNPPWESDEGVLRHELVHFKQARMLGILMPVAYVVGSLLAMIQGKDAYQDNFLEAWARKESGY